jgi:hypothetical protein
LAGELIEERFGIEKIEMTGATLHEEPDHILGSSDGMRNLGGSTRFGTCGAKKGGLAKQRRESDRSETAP